MCENKCKYRTDGTTTSNKGGEGVYVSSSNQFSSVQVKRKYLKPKTSEMNTTRTSSKEEEEECEGM
jgi:hypothetical protein